MYLYSVRVRNDLLHEGQTHVIPRESSGLVGLEACGGEGSGDELDIDWKQKLLDSVSNVDGLEDRGEGGIGSFS